MKTINLETTFTKKANSAVLYVHGKGGSANEAEHWFHTEEQMAFLDEWMKNKTLD